MHRPLPPRCKKKAPKPALPPGARVLATIPLGERVDPIWITADDAAVWVHSLDHVLRVDPATNAVVGRVPAPSVVFGYLATGAGSVWQSDFGNNVLLRIDPQSNRLVATIPLGADAAPEGVGVAAGAVWVANHHRGTVSRIDPASNTITATIIVGPVGRSGPLELAAGAAGVWVNVLNARKVVHIDPTTNAVVGSVPEVGKPILDGNNVWIETAADVVRVDAATNKIVARIKTAPPNAWGAAAFGSVWVPTTAGLARIDQATNKVIGVLKTVPKGDLAIAAGSIWLAAYGKGKLYRLAAIR